MSSKALGETIKPYNNKYNHFADDIQG